MFRKKVMAVRRRNVRGGGGGSGYGREMCVI